MAYKYLVIGYLNNIKDMKHVCDYLFFESYKDLLDTTEDMISDKRYKYITIYKKIHIK